MNVWRCEGDEEECIGCQETAKEVESDTEGARHVGERQASAVVVGTELCSKWCFEQGSEGESSAITIASRSPRTKVQVGPEIEMDSGDRRGREVLAVSASDH